MSKEKIIRLIIGAIVIILFYNLLTLYQFKQTLTQHVMDEIKEYTLEINELVNENSSLIARIIKNKEIKYDDLDYLYQNEDEINDSFIKILKKLKAIKSYDYLKKHIRGLHNPLMTTKDILYSYRDVKKRFNDKDKIILEKEDIKTLEVILNAYKFRNVNLDKIVKKIDNKDESWVKELEQIFLFNMWTNYNKGV